MHTIGMPLFGGLSDSQQQSWLSFGGDAGVVYVFAHLLPDLDTASLEFLPLLIIFIPIPSGCVDGICLR